MNNNVELVPFPSITVVVGAEIDSLMNGKVRLNKQAQTNVISIDDLLPLDLGLMVLADGDVSAADLNEGGGNALSCLSVKLHEVRIPCACDLGAASVELGLDACFQSGKLVLLGHSKGRTNFLLVFG